MPGLNEYAMMMDPSVAGQGPSQPTPATQMPQEHPLQRHADMMNYFMKTLMLPADAAAALAVKLLPPKVQSGEKTWPVFQQDQLDAGTAARIRNIEGQRNYDRTWALRDTAKPVAPAWGPGADTFRKGR